MAMVSGGERTAKERQTLAIEIELAQRAEQLIDQDQHISIIEMTEVGHVKLKSLDH